MFNFPTVYELFEEMSSEKELKTKNIRIYIQNFLHYINNLQDNNEFTKIYELFIEEPKHYENIPHYVYAYFSAIIESISIEFHIKQPKWIDGDFYFLNEEWFPEEIEKFKRVKERLRECSPMPFKKRNLYVSENAISVC